MKEIMIKFFIGIIPIHLKKAGKKIIKKLENIKFVYKNDSIEGEMLRGELNWLFLTAQKMNHIVEIGSWKGRSTHALLSGCPGTVHAVDTFGRKDSYEDFIKNVGHFKNLKVYKMDSLEAARKFKDKSIDMVFIDADHSYGAVKADIEAWLPKTKKLICGHDYESSKWFEVIKAVDEKFSKVSIIDHIWFYYL